MKKKYRKLTKKEIYSINGGSWWPVTTAIIFGYDAVTDFYKGFKRGFNEG